MQREIKTATMSMNGKEASMDTTEDLTPSESLSLGDSYYVDEDYQQAVDAYAAALAVIMAPEKHIVLKRRALSHRSAAFFQLGRYEEARDDAIAALTTCPPSDGGLRPGEMELLHKRIGLASLELMQYHEAKQAMEQASQLASLNGKDAAQYEKWIQQCQEKLKTKPTATNRAASTETTSAVNPTGQSPAARPAGPVNQRPTIPKYQYYQSDAVMTIAILEPGVQEENLHVNFAPKKLSIQLRKGNQTFTILHGTLYDRVVIDRCRIRILDEKVLIKLRKESPHEWHNLMGKGTDNDDDDDDDDDNIAEAKEKEVNTKALSQKEIPTVDANKARAYSSHRDWDAIERNLEQQEKQETPEGDDAMNQLFQQIYKNADENTRRAMIKSYQTSGGTVLSTNWNEVAGKDYEKERTAPTGMEWKTWEGDKLDQTKP